MTENMLPHKAMMAIKDLQASLYAELARKMRKYWHRIAILMKVTDNG